MPSLRFFKADRPRNTVIFSSHRFLSWLKLLEPHLKAAYGLVSAPRERFGEVDEVASNKFDMRRLKADPCTSIKLDP